MTAGQGCAGQGDDLMSLDWPRRSGKRLTADLPAAEFRRLGKAGAYRLGLLRAQGVAVRRQPTPFRARFARRRDHRFRSLVWLLGLLASVAVIAVGTAVGLVFMPLLAGVGAGVANRAGGWPPRVALPAVSAMGAAGWILPFLLSNGSGSAGGGLARAAAALTGLPGQAAGVAALTTLIAVVQTLGGYFLASVIMPRYDQLR
jgi:hypothetical protein